jgi:hypothetical protein
MNFQEFCEQAKKIDQQTVLTNNSFVINFSKPEGSAFTIDPQDIVSFLKILSSEHQQCKTAIQDDARFISNKNYTNYQEKPYRALYKLAANFDLNTISSLGGSQTKELTKVISKLIAFLAGLQYEKIEDDTFYDKDNVDAALANMPLDLKALGPQNSQTSIDMNLSRKKRFVRWLELRGLAERTIASYAGTSISVADEILKQNANTSKNLYEMSSSEEVSKANEWLNSNTEWKQKNAKGNGMYEAGIKMYVQFREAIPVESRLPKPFILLAGISGTGKTRFVKEQAKEQGVGDINFCQIPVRPDWHEPSDLLGYVSRISGTKYIATKALKFIIDAWRVVAPNADKEGMGDLDLAVAPYWLCLDEMNLAPVEQYFADYLSVLESRKFENGKYTCEPLLTQSNFQMDIKSLRTDLGISDDEDGLWEYFSHHGIPLPPNLIVAGTVNMDETTHGFSRKVIDRACTLDFGEFFPNDYQKFFSGQELPKTFTYSQLTHASQKDLINTFDVDGAKTVAFLESINEVLKQTPFELAYRALNELLLHVACFSPQDEKELQAVWDDFLMTKVLPRIDGDDDKLRLVRKGEPANLLEVLAVLLESNLNEIWAEGKTKKDFFRNTQDEIPCRSRTKIEWMKNRLEANTFTSFWP